MPNLGALLSDYLQLQSTWCGCRGGPETWCISQTCSSLHRGNTDIVFLACIHVKTC